MGLDFQDFGKGRELEVWYTYQKPRRGLRDSMGVPITPDEDEELEIEDIYFFSKKFGKRVYLSNPSKNLLKEVERRLRKG